MSNNLRNKDIRLFDKCYVGMIAREEDSQPLGFMTEWGTDKAAVKRMASVDSWVRGAYGQLPNARNFPTRIYENKPMVGFRLGRSVKRQSRESNNVVWRIEDPRGFDLEISSPNMAQIMAETVLDRGEILDQCIWARQRGDNILVPLSSSIYQTVVKNTQRHGKSVKPGDVKIGNRIVLNNGQEGVYLGKLFSLKNSYYGLPNWHKSRHFIKTDEDILIEYANLKVAEILDTSEIDPAEAERLASEPTIPRAFEITPIGDLQRRPVSLNDAVESDLRGIITIDGELLLFAPHRRMLNPSNFNIDLLCCGLESAGPEGLKFVFEQQNGWSRAHMKQKYIKLSPQSLAQYPIEIIFYEITTALGNTFRCRT